MVERVDGSKGVAVLRVNAHELDLLRSAIREASEALEDWEFETRMGCSRDELRGLALQIRDVEISLRQRPD